MEREYGYMFDIMIIGDSGVGKTAILRQYRDGTFTPLTDVTVGIDFCIQAHEIGGSQVKVRFQ